MDGILPFAPCELFQRTLHQGPPWSRIRCQSVRGVVPCVSPKNSWSQKVTLPVWHSFLPYPAKERRWKTESKDLESNNIYIYIIDSLNFNGLDIPIWLSFWFVLNITSYLQIAMGSPVPAGQILLERDTQLGCTEMPWWNLGWATLTKTLGFSSRIVECTPWKFQKFHLWTYNADTLPRSQTLNVRMSEKKIPSHLSGQSTLRSAGDCGDGVPNCVSAQFCGFLVPLLDTSNPIRIRFLNQYFD